MTEIATKMYRNIEIKVRVGILLCACVTCAHAQTADLTGQASGWISARQHSTQVGARYIPELSLVNPLSDTTELSAEAAVNAHWFSQYDGSHYTQSASKADPYRLWARFASPQFEARAGLQKISFGSATLLRPLQWFDSTDPRDPLALTDGVTGLLGRTYFQDNTNIWVWALNGNNDLKGWETVPTDKRAIEVGGRVQVPVKNGEMALSYHRRRANPNGTVFGAAYPAQGKFSEDQFGLDGKWDVGVGLWFEGTVMHRKYDIAKPRYLHRVTVGTDYTFDVGNGPHLVLEQFVQGEADGIWTPGKGHWISAASLDTPFSLLDTGAAIVYYDWDSNQWSRLLQWRRTYDQWQVHVSAFWNPDRTALAHDTAAVNSFTGKGVQLMLVFNH